MKCPVVACWRWTFSKRGLPVNNISTRRRSKLPLAKSASRSSMVISGSFSNVGDREDQVYVLRISPFDVSKHRDATDKQIIYLRARGAGANNRWTDSGRESAFKISSPEFLKLNATALRMTSPMCTLDAFMLANYSTSVGLRCHERCGSFLGGLRTAPTATSRGCGRPRGPAPSPAPCCGSPRTPGRVRSRRRRRLRPGSRRRRL